MEVHQLEQADADVVELTEKLMNLELKGRWHNRSGAVADRQKELREQISPPVLADDTELRYLLTAFGEILQLLPSNEEHRTRGATLGPPGS